MDKTMKDCSDEMVFCDASCECEYPAEVRVGDKALCQNHMPHDPVEHARLLAKMLGKAIKRAYKGSTVRQGYVGTGSQAYRRQLWVRLPNGVGIDLWIGKHVEFGGVCYRGIVKAEPFGACPEDTCKAVVAKIEPLTKKEMM